MAGKTYIKTGDNSWSRVKKIYLKTGGITWQAVRKAYLKTGSSTWKKVYDSTSNRPFIGNDIPKIRLNTFRTNSSVAGTVNPVVEAPRVQKMGPPTTTPTVGWPTGTVGNHLYGYDGTWTSGNGSTITFIYQWLYNVTGNSNDNVFDPQFYTSDTTSSRNTSSTGRADMLTNSSSYLGYDDGNYFDKNFITFRVGASNSAGGPIFSESVPVYIVKQTPGGTIDLINTSVDIPETLAARFTYNNQWYNSPDLYESKVEWFAIDSVGEALTASNRVQSDYLYTFSVTGTTTKEGTVYHNATVPGKIYAVRLTLNNSNTQNSVIPVIGFTPNAPFITDDFSTPGSSLEVTTLDILDYYNNEGTDNRLYIPNGGLFKIRSNVEGVDGNTTYRIRYRMYNWQNNSYYGMDGTNYGASANSAWTTRTGTNSSFGFGGSLINVISVAGTTATLTHNEIISSAHFGSTTFDGGQDRWQIEIEVSVLKNSIRKYYLDFVGGIPYYVSRPATLSLDASPGTAPINTNITLSGTISALGGGLSYPRQYKVNFGDGSDSGWLPVGGYAYGTSNPSFSITKQYSTAGDYYPSFTTIPDYSSANTNVIIASVPTITMLFNSGVGPNGGTINWTSTNQASFSATGAFSGTGTTGTSITRNTLLSNTTYTGTVTITSSTGQTASANYSLTTSAPVYTMPNIIGMTKIAGGNAIVDAGFYWEGDTETYTTNASLDQIIFAQTPAAGFVGIPQNAYFDYYVYQAAALTAPSIYSVSSGNANGPVTVYFSGGSGPYYQIWWSTGSTGTGYDESGSSNPITDNTGPSYAGTWYAYVRSVSSPTNTGSGGSSSISDWSAAYSFTVTEPAPTITYGDCTSYGSSIALSEGYICSGNYSYYYTDNTYYQRRQVLVNGTWNNTYNYDCSNTTVRTYGNFIQVNGQCGYTTPTPTPVECVYSDYGSYHYSPGCHPSGTPRSGSLSGVTSGACCPTVYKTAKFVCKYYDAYNSASVNYSQCYYEGECAALQNPDGSRSVCYV